MQNEYLLTDVVKVGEHFKEANKLSDALFLNTPFARELACVITCFKIEYDLPADAELTPHLEYRLSAEANQRFIQLLARYEIGYLTKSERFLTWSTYSIEQRHPN